MSTAITHKPIGDVSLTWGESLCWDDRKERLYFVDCATQKLYWMDQAKAPLFELDLPSKPTGMGLIENGQIILALDNGLNVVDPESNTIELLTPYPAELGGRANDATIDGNGSFITGTLRAETGEGSVWSYSTALGWWKLVSGVSNFNGPVSKITAGQNSLIFSDTPAQLLHACDYNPQNQTASQKFNIGDTSLLGGYPDGSCATDDGAILSCIIGPGKLACYTTAGLQNVIDAGMEQPSDVTFGGADLDRLFVVSIAMDVGAGIPASPLTGALVEIEGTGLKGAPENRFQL